MFYVAKSIPKTESFTEFLNQIKKDFQSVVGDRVSNNADG